MNGKPCKDLLVRLATKVIYPDADTKVMRREWHILGTEVPDIICDVLKHMSERAVQQLHPTEDCVVAEAWSHPQAVDPNRIDFTVYAEGSDVVSGKHRRQFDKRLLEDPTDAVGRPADASRIRLGSHVPSSEPLLAHRVIERRPPPSSVKPTLHYKVDAIKRLLKDEPSMIIALELTLKKCKHREHVFTILRLAGETRTYVTPHWLEHPNLLTVADELTSLFE